MMEIYWGTPMVLECPQAGTRQKVTTIEEAQYCLQKGWPHAGPARDSALAEVEAAMVCMRPVEVARAAFLHAALTAGYRTSRPEPDSGDVQSRLS